MVFPHLFQDKVCTNTYFVNPFTNINTKCEQKSITPRGKYCRNYQTFEVQVKRPLYKYLYCTKVSAQVT